jgi:hypothetical protein
VSAGPFGGGDTRTEMTPNDSIFSTCLRRPKSWQEESRSVSARPLTKPRQHFTGVLLHSGFDNVGALIPASGPHRKTELRSESNWLREMKLDLRSRWQDEVSRGYLRSTTPRHTLRFTGAGCFERNRSSTETDPGQINSQRRGAHLGRAFNLSDEPGSGTGDDRSFDYKVLFELRGKFLSNCILGVNELDVDNQSRPLESFPHSTFRLHQARTDKLQGRIFAAH